MAYRFPVLELIPNRTICMKHSTKCNNRVQWMLNRLCDSLIPQKHLARFFSTICTCERNQPIEDPWEDISSRHLIDSLAFLDNYVSQNIDNVQANVIQQMLLHLRQQRVVPSKADLPRLNPSECSDSDCRTSAFKMLHLLQKAIEGNYTLLLPPRREEVPEKIKDWSLTFDLENFNHDFLKNLIGAGGREILPFMKRYRCYVKFDKVPTGDDFKVTATIKKRAESIEALKRIQPELERMAKDRQELEESYEEVRKEQEEQTRDKFIGVLKMTEGMGPSADWNTILIKIERHAQYDDIRQHADLDDQKQWFDEIKENWDEISRSDQGNSVLLSAAGAAPEASSDNDSPVSIEETTAKEVTTSNTYNSLPAGSEIQTSVQPASSSSHNTAGSDVQTSVQIPSSSNHSTIQPLALPPMSAPTSQPPQLLGMPPTGDATTLCIVHDRRWVPTFQYFLTQCYTQINMPRKYGYPLSQHICSCGKPKSDPIEYFFLHVRTLDAFNNVKTLLNCWPLEQKTLVQPVIRQLEKFKEAETYESLLKLVYYYQAMKDQKYDTLDPGAKLPYRGSTMFRPAAPTVAAVSAQPRGEIGSGNGGASQAAVGGASVSSLGQGPSGIVPVQSSTLGASAGLPPSPGAVGGVGGIKRSHSSSPDSCQCQLCVGSKDKQVKQPAPKMDTLQTEASPQPPKKKLRKLSPDDWIEDCHFHGKKKKFLFQCIVNYLHKYARLPVKLNIPFSLAVCCCGETVEFKDYFKSESECVEHCQFMKMKLMSWRGDSKASVKSFLAQLDDYINNKNITNGFLKFVYYFKKGFTGDLYDFNDIHDQLKRQRNSAS